MPFIAASLHGPVFDPKRCRTSLVFWWGGWVPMPTHTHPYPSIPHPYPSNGGSENPKDLQFLKPGAVAVPRVEPLARWPTVCDELALYGPAEGASRDHEETTGYVQQWKTLNHLNPYWSIIVLHFYMTNNLGLGTRVHCMLFCTFSVLHGADHADPMPSDSCGILRPQGLKLASDSEMECFDQLSPRSQRRWAWNGRSVAMLLDVTGKPHLKQRTRCYWELTESRSASWISWIFSSWRWADLFSATKKTYKHHKITGGLSL